MEIHPFYLLKSILCVGLCCLTLPSTYYALEQSTDIVKFPFTSSSQSLNRYDVASFSEVERRYNWSELYDIKQLETLYSQSQVNTTYIGAFIRRLVGSNCILVERGTITPYYACLGCRVEEAMGCIDDMRLNKSGNVRYGCNINSMHEKRDEKCCPAFTSNKRPQYMGLSYPEGLRCLERIGCSDSVFYQDIFAECRRTCNFNIPGSDRSVCFAGSQGMFLTNLRSHAQPVKILSSHALLLFTTILSFWLFF